MQGGAIEGGERTQVRVRIGRVAVAARGRQGAVHAGVLTVDAARARSDASPRRRVRAGRDVDAAARGGGVPITAQGGIVDSGGGRRMPPRSGGAGDLGFVSVATVVDGGAEDAASRSGRRGRRRSRRCGMRFRGSLRMPRADSFLCVSAGCSTNVVNTVHFGQADRACRASS
ncbi:hypothetical protein GCM10009840_29100 [Pseudolysinimonas kribbensis]